MGSHTPKLVRARVALRRAAACMTVALLTVEPTVANAAACAPTPDQASVGMRALQTELMVAGLKCSAEKFNAFTSQFRSTIKLNADRLQTLFKKTYGAAGPTRMNSFVTQLANDASQRSNGASEKDYCRQEDRLFEQVLALTAAELEQFSAGRSLAVAAPVALCAPEPAQPVLPVSAAVSPPAASSSRKAR